MKDFLLKLLAVIVAGICTGIAVFFGWKVYQQKMMYKEGDDTYEMIEHLAQATPMTEEVPANRPEPSTFEPETTAPVSIIEEPEDPQNQEEPIPVAEIDFAALTAVNSDVVAWICCPDTVLNYPVVHGEDNEYYLTHLVDGTENGNGTLFIDWKNSRDFSDENTVVYGHHMQSGKMFACLVEYADQAFFDAHPIIYLVTPEAKYKIELFSGYTTTFDSSAYTLRFSSSHEYAEWLREIARKSDFKANLHLSTNDHIITLSTCAYSFYDARYVVHGRLTQVGGRSNS
ncbi:MAG: class B sortase [Firmicutes bacterium]|nr:class B sortase [Bacillota bacterium]